jgi:hypothetical protein
MILDGQVLEEELAREVVVGLNAADLGGCQKDVFWPDAGKKTSTAWESQRSNSRERLPMRLRYPCRSRLRQMALPARPWWPAT